VSPRRRSHITLTVSEPAVNVELAHLLDKKGLRALGEVRIHESRARPDIYLTLNGVRIILEGKFEGPSVLEALERQCRERVEQNLCDVAIGLVYPKPIPKNLSLTLSDLERFLQDCRYRMKAFWPSPAGIEETPWEQGLTFRQVVERIQSSYRSLVQGDLVGQFAERFRAALDDFHDALAAGRYSLRDLAEQVRTAMALPAEAPEQDEADEEEAEG